MPYGRGETAATPTPPGPEVNRAATGQQLYQNGLSGTRLLSDPGQWVFGGGAASTEVIGTPSVSPIGDAAFFDLTGAGVADTVSQALTAAFDGGTVYIGSLYVDATASTSTAARLVLVVGGIASTLDFIPQNGTIIAQSGPGSFTVDSFVVGNQTFLRLLIRVANPAAASPQSFTITPAIPPSAAGVLRVQAPMVAVTFDAALGLPVNAALFANPAFIESGAAATGQFGISTAGALPQYQVAAPWQIMGLDGSISGSRFLDFSGALAKTISFPPGAVPQSIILPLATSGGLDQIPQGWYCWFTQGNQPGFPALVIDFSINGQTVYVNGLEPMSGPTLSLPSAAVPSSTALLVYLGANEWAVYPTNARREMRFTAAGAFAWPYGVAEILARGVGGGGGGGGGGTDAVNAEGGGGGGSGEYREDVISGQVAGSVHAVVIGTGGAAGAGGGAIGATGTAGGTTTLGALASWAGGNGGTGGNATTTFPGGGGASNSVSGSVARTKRLVGLQTIAAGGDGGGNPLGGPGANVQSYSTQNNAPANSHGAGGTGGPAVQGLVGFVGGNGADGALFIRW